LVLRDRDTDGNGSLDERLYALQDANWNTTGLVNAGGTVQERYAYTPFGQVTFRDGTGSTLSNSAKDWIFLHQGGERIVAGDYEFRNRLYSPSLGRWLSNDPLGFEAGDQNWYRAIGNNPGNAVDPSGEFLINLVSGLTGAAIGAVFGYYSTGTWKGTLVGGAAGGVAGLTLGTIGPSIATLTGSGWLGGATASATSGITGDITHQLASMYLGSQSNYNYQQTLLSAAVGFATGGLLFRPGNAPAQIISHWGGQIVPGTINKPMWVQIGKPGYFTWIMSGSIGKYPLSGGISVSVNGAKLHYPVGFEGFKGLIGQRILID
jgi:RHS repeat-associated protein